MGLAGEPKPYVAVAAAFVAGVLLTLGLRDLYPHLGRRLRRRESKPFLGQEDRHGWRRLLQPSARDQVQLQDLDAVATATSSAVAGPVRGFDVRDGIEDCIGGTPLVRIRSLSEATGCTIMAKAEFLNGAGGSPKDRVALNMIRDAEARGLLVPGRGDTIYEGTVGSTGISLAMLARARGYRAHICMPNDQSQEKSDLLRCLGATVERVPVAPIADPAHFVNLARARAEQHAERFPGSQGFYASQFDSAANHQAHLQSTGPEIVHQTGGDIDAFVAGAGTGGTISGVAMYLKEEAGLSRLRVVLADPQGSGLYNRVMHGVMYSPSEREGTRRRQQIDSIVEGIGLKWLTANFEAGRELIDDAVRVTDGQACRMARWLAEHDGIFVGSSSAVNCVAAVATAQTMPRGSRIVTILCDSGSRHLSRFWKQIAEMEQEELEKSCAKITREKGQSNLFNVLDLPPREDILPHEQ